MTLTNKDSVMSAKTGELIAYRNEFSGKTPIKKFSDRATAEKRVLALVIERASAALALAVLPPAEVEPAERPVSEILPALIAGVKLTAKEVAARRRVRIAADKVARSEREAIAKVEASKKRETKGFEALPVEGKVRAVRASSKIAAIIDAIAKPGGSTLAEIAALTVAGVPLLSPKATVRGLLAFDLRGVLGYGYTSSDGERVSILYPKGLSAPIPHVAIVEKKEVVA